MNKILLSILAFALAGCETMPVIIPDKTGDNVIMMTLKDQIAQSGTIQPSYGWLFWYAPIFFIALMWAWREFIHKSVECDEQVETSKEEKD